MIQVVENVPVGVSLTVGAVVTVDDVRVEADGCVVPVLELKVSEDPELEVPGGLEDEVAE